MLRPGQMILPSCRFQNPQRPFAQLKKLPLFFGFPSCINSRNGLLISQRVTPKSWVGNKSSAWPHERPKSASEFSNFFWPIHSEQTGGAGSWRGVKLQQQFARQTFNLRGKCCGFTMELNRNDTTVVSKPRANLSCQVERPRA